MNVAGGGLTIKKDLKCSKMRKLKCIYQLSYEDIKLLTSFVNSDALLICDTV